SCSFRGDVTASVRRGSLPRRLLSVFGRTRVSCDADESLPRPRLFSGCRPRSCSFLPESLRLRSLSESGWTRAFPRSSPRDSGRPSPRACFESWFLRSVCLREVRSTYPLDGLSTVATRFDNVRLASVGGVCLH